MDCSLLVRPSSTASAYLPLHWWCWSESGRKPRSVLPCRFGAMMCLARRSAAAEPPYLLTRHRRLSTASASIITGTLQIVHICASPLYVQRNARLIRNLELHRAGLGSSGKMPRRFRYCEQAGCIRLYAPRLRQREHRRRVRCNCVFLFCTRPAENADDHARIIGPAHLCHAVANRVGGRDSRGVWGL